MTATFNSLGLKSTGRLTEAQGEFNLKLAADSALPWKEYTVSVFDDSGDSVSTATGVVSIERLEVGSGKREATQTISLASGDWAIDAAQGPVSDVFVSVSGLNSDHTYEVTAISWN